MLRYRYVNADLSYAWVGLVIAAAAAGGWHLRRVLWRKKHAELVTGSILKCEQIGSTAEYTRYLLTVEFTDSDGDPDTVQLVTCSRATAESPTVELSVVAESKLWGKRRKPVFLEERAYLYMSDETRRNAQLLESRVQRRERMHYGLSSIFHPEYFAARAEFADKKANAEPKHPLRDNVWVQFLVMLLVIGIALGIIFAIAVYVMEHT